MKTNQTFTILFWLYKSKMNNGKAPIYCRITIEGERLQFAVQRNIEPSKWISAAAMVKGNSEEARTINTYLDFVKVELHKHYNMLLSTNQTISVHTLRNSYLGIKEKHKGLVEVFNYHNDQMKELIGIDVVKSTHTKFQTVLSKLESFLKENFKRSEINLKELDHKFISDFEYFLKVNEKIGHNTTMKYIRNLKKVINMAISNDWLTKNPFGNFKCSNKKVIREILTSEEIISLSEKEFKMERLTEVRDIFLFCCYTGYAFVDVERLSKNDVVIGIDGGKWIYTNRQKTGTQSNVPLLPLAVEILEKYENHPYCENKGKLLPVKSNQKMNAYLKEVADLCDINKPLTMHIARHTFATTVTLSNGVPIETVSKLLGHTKLATTQIYAQVLQNKVSEDMSKLKEIYSTKKGVEKTGTN